MADLLSGLPAGFSGYTLDQLPQVFPCQNALTSEWCTLTAAAPHFWASYERAARL